MSAYSTFNKSNFNNNVNFLQDSYIKQSVTAPQNVTAPFTSFPPPNISGPNHVFSNGVRFPNNNAPPSANVFSGNVHPFSSVPPPPIIKSAISPNPWNSAPMLNNNLALNRNHPQQPFPNVAVNAGFVPTIASNPARSNFEGNRNVDFSQKPIVNALQNSQPQPPTNGLRQVSLEFNFKKPANLNREYQTLRNTPQNSYLDRRVSNSSTLGGQNVFSANELPFNSVTPPPNVKSERYFDIAQPAISPNPWNNAPTLNNNLILNQNHHQQQPIQSVTGNVGFDPANTTNYFEGNRSVDYSQKPIANAPNFNQQAYANDTTRQNSSDFNFQKPANLNHEFQKQRIFLETTPQNSFLDRRVSNSGYTPIVQNLSNSNSDLQTPRTWAGSIPQQYSDFTDSNPLISSTISSSNSNQTPNTWSGAVLQPSYSNNFVSNLGSSFQNSRNMNSNNFNSPNVWSNTVSSVSSTNTYEGRNNSVFSRSNNFQGQRQNSVSPNRNYRSNSLINCSPSNVKRENSPTTWNNNYQNGRFPRNNFRSNYHNSSSYGNRHTSKANQGITNPLFTCDTCDRAFGTQSEFDSHNSEHVKCKVGNCQFEAHPKIVFLHKKMQHDTGYADKISKLKDAKEIENWIAERKKRFPTAENILKRKAEQAEKEARGEIVENVEIGKLNGQKATENGNRRKYKRRRQVSKFERRDKFVSNEVLTDSESDGDEDAHIKLTRFPGLVAVESGSAEAEPNDSVEAGEHNISTDCDNQNGEAESTQNSSVLIVDKTPNKNVPTVVDLSSADETAETITLSSDTEAVQDILASKRPTSSSSNHSMTETPKSQGKRKSVSFTVSSDDEAPIEIPALKRSRNSLCLGNGNEGETLPNGGEDAQKVQRKRNSDAFTESSDDAPNEIPVAKRSRPENDLEGCHAMTNGKEVRFSERTTLVDFADNSDDDAPLEMPIEKSTHNDHELPLNPQENLVINGEHKELDSEVAAKQAEVDVSSNAIESNDRKGQDSKMDNRNRRNKNGHHSNKPTEKPSYYQRTKPSLLEKLLADDIRHERNVIMQCIRHIVGKDYFGIGKK